MAMISRSEGFANAFLAFLNPNQDIKDITEAPPISQKLSIPFNAEPPKPKRGKRKQKTADDLLDEDDIPVLNIIPNRQEGQESEVVDDPPPQEEIAYKTSKKRGAIQASKKTPSPRGRAKKTEEVEEETIESKGEDESDEEDESDVEEVTKELTDGSDFEVELKEAPNRRNVSTRRSARVTRKSFAHLLKDDDTDETDSDDIVEVPSSPIKGKGKPSSPIAKSQNDAKKQIHDAKNPKDAPKAKTALTKSKQTGRRQSLASKVGSSNQSNDSAEENTVKKEEESTQVLDGPAQNKTVIENTRGRKRKVDPTKENPQPQPISQAETDVRPRSVRARQPTRKVSMDLDDEPLAKSVRMSKSARKQNSLAKTPEKDVQELKKSTSKQSDDHKKSTPTLKIKPQAGLEIRKIEERTETPSKRERTLKVGESESKSPENSTGFQSQSSTSVTFPSKAQLADQLAENAAKDANLKSSSNVVAITCSRCAKSVATEQELMSHFNEVHRAEILKANQSKVKIKSMTKLHACPHCPYKTEWESSLGIHLKLSHGNAPKTSKTMTGDL
ncbi:muscle M-line assembly protein unc-89-like isoform X2 [Tigriopus californicus]|uniref:muscle M-line assembly protein unc-89-like isoform X2 n=1 Tax=Tigriopus californicus TaxID=6832 RepID=UPI0027DA61C5|nr:muscle M-line assembly protein unc-89-like isoform X2 [Tigriopus californicus]